MDDNSRKRPLSGQWLIDTAERVRQKPRVGSIDASNATSKFFGQGVQHTGQGDLNVGRDINITPNNTEENCLRDLFITDPSEDRTALKRKKGNRAAGTCEWILETEELAAWLYQEQTSNVLWLYGNPGTGKSTMAIFLTEQLSKVFSATEGKTLAYFFCDSSFDKRKTATSVIRGLLFQLIEQHRQLLEYVLPKYKERGADLFKSFDALWAIFMAAAADETTGQKYCIIDALDECDRESQKILLQLFHETFLNQDTSSKIRILITSRPYSEICEYLDDFANKDLGSFPQTNEDIDRCIEERVIDLAKKKHYTGKVKQQVSDILRDKAEGTFLWVGLACEELKQTPSKDAVKALQDMPKGLHSLYETLLNTAKDDSEADKIRRILGFVAVCMRPLSVLELSEACQLFEDEMDIETRVQFTREQIASCRLMIIVQDEKVLLLHQSVKDFLVGASPGYFINELEAHANIVYRCVNLLIEDFHGSEQSSMHFFAYAIERWLDHARMAQAKFEVRESEAEFFQLKSPSRERWLETIYDRLKYFTFSDIYHLPKFYRIPRNMSILHIAGRWGIASLVDHITNQYCSESNTKKLVSFIDLDCVDSDNATPIELAVKWGSISVISKLLSLDAKVGVPVVTAAAKNWRYGKEIMALLLDRRGDQIIITEDIVKAAASNHNIDMIEFLFDQRGNQIIITEDIVKAAAGNYNDEVMEFLLDRRGNQITITESIVKAAARNRNDKVIELLFDRRGDQITITEDIVKAAVGDPNKELQALIHRPRNQMADEEDLFRAAASNGNNKAIIGLLLDRQGDQITMTEDIIQAAAGNRRNGTEVIVLLFDQYGDQIAITENVLKAAAGNGDQCKKVMTLLLDRCGDQITITGDVFKAAIGNWEKAKEIVALLLDRCGDQIVITEDIVKFSAGNWRNGKEVMILLLNEYGDQIMITEDIVKAAAGNWETGKEVMALLFDWQGDQITITEDIMKAAAGNQRQGKEILTLLLDWCGDQGTITEDIVKAAATSGQDEVLNFLSRQNLIISDWDKWYRISEFYNAASNGDIHTIEQLLDQGVNPDLKDVSGTTPLWIAAASGYEEIVKVLVQRTDVDINSRSISGASPLFMPAIQGFEQVLSILMEGGADPQIVDEYGETAVTRAMNEKIAKMLERVG